MRAVMDAIGRPYSDFIFRSLVLAALHHSHLLCNPLGNAVGGGGNLLGQTVWRLAGFGQPLVNYLSAKLSARRQL